jgi:MSHA pilin protein MshC
MRGFTLVELILVILIAGILAAVVGPRFFDRRVFDERLFYQETLGALRYAQSYAVATGCLTRVTLDAGSGYHLYRAANCTGGAYLAEVPTPDGQSSFASTSVPDGIGLSATGFPLTFNALGQPSSAASVSVGGRSLTVAAETGLVQ